jgi:hypothetical protein
MAIIIIPYVQEKSLIPFYLVDFTLTVILLFKLPSQGDGANAGRYKFSCEAFFSKANFSYADNSTEKYILYFKRTIS